VESKVHSALRPPMAYCASLGWLWWWRNRWNDWQGKPKYSEKTCPVPLCPPQTPHAALTRAQAAAVGSQRLTAWATARPIYFIYFSSYVFRYRPIHFLIHLLQFSSHHHAHMSQFYRALLDSCFATRIRAPVLFGLRESRGVLVRHWYHVPPGVTCFPLILPLFGCISMIKYT
jgi:hypothetical protein